jgi:tRNA nucleotidyltransferase/poly(A) polymerase
MIGNLQTIWPKQGGIILGLETNGMPQVTNALLLMTALEDAGYPTYIVGGAVRDTIMKNPIKDLDITTLATPVQVEEVVQTLHDFHYITGGQAAVSIANLVSLVNFPGHKKGQPHDIEIATFRTDEGYERDEDGNRDRTRPILAPALTLQEDLKRRDFTINAIAMDKSFRIIDPFGGMDDIKAGIVRAVGKPRLRFAEDPVRMIRAVRFSTRYGFTMDPPTREAIVDNLAWIERISPPRMRDEMGKVLMQKGGFQELYALGIIPYLMPELSDIKDLEHNPAYHPEGSVFGHYCAMFDRLGDAVKDSPPAPTPIYFPQFGHRTAGGGASDMIAWALLFHDIGKKSTAEASTKGDFFSFHAHESVGASIFSENYGSGSPSPPYEFSRKESEAITWTTLFHLGKFWDSKKFAKVRKMVLSPFFDLLCSVAYFDTSMRVKGERFEERMEYLGEMRDKVAHRMAQNPMPKGFGTVVSEVLDIQPGPELGRVLMEMQEKVLAGKFSDYDTALDSYR